MKLYTKDQIENSEFNVEQLKEIVFNYIDRVCKLASIARNQRQTCRNLQKKVEKLQADKKTFKRVINGQFGVHTTDPLLYTLNITIDGERFDLPKLIKAYKDLKLASSLLQDAYNKLALNPSKERKVIEIEELSSVKEELKNAYKEIEELKKGCGISIDNKVFDVDSLSKEYIKLKKEIDYYKNPWPNVQDLSQYSFIKESDVVSRLDMILDALVDIRKNQK